MPMQYYAGSFYDLRSGTLRFYGNLRKSNTFFITFDKTDVFFVDNFPDKQNNPMCKKLNVK